MPLTRWRTARDESRFVLLAASVTTVVASILSFAHVPNILSLLCVFYVCRAFWRESPPEAELPIKTLVRALINVIYLGNISAAGLFLGSKYFRQFTLKDSYELYYGRMVTSDKALKVYFWYYLGFWVQMLSHVNLMRVMDNLFTGIASYIRNLTQA